jgi:hypothetical protein
MPWREVSIMDERREFVGLAMQEGANRRELCRRFGIHPDTGYKRLSRPTPKSGISTAQPQLPRAKWLGRQMRATDLSDG